MACTATATRSVHGEVIRSLEMSGCVRISKSPDRPNIYYKVEARTDVESDFAELLVSLRDNLVKTPRVIVYCRSLDICSNLYAHFHYELAESSYYPPDAPKLSDNRLFGMFHASTPQHNKDVILNSLLVPDGVVRVVFATVALGMGIDLQGVNTIIHYGAPQSIEDYFQESGRGGRSGESACSTVYWKPVDCPIRKEPKTIQHRELISVRAYLENTSVCRRKLLLEHLDPKCAEPGEDPQKCCDVCSGNYTRDEGYIDP